MIRIPVLVALVGCGSSEEARPRETPRDAAVERADLGATAAQLGCGAAAPVAITCDTAGGKVVRVTLTTPTSDDDAERVMRDAVAKVLDAMTPPLVSGLHDLALHTLTSSQTASIDIEGLMFRFESGDAGQRYWIEPQ